MLTVHVPNGTSLARRTIGPDDVIPEDAVWLDLLSPGPSDDKVVERAVGVSVPTREEMQEIEPTSRLYAENGARYMTITLMCRSDSERPTTTPVTFILAGRRLITVRYDEPRSFVIVTNKLTRQGPAEITGDAVLMELLEVIIDRGADILEHIGADVDSLSREIFQSEQTGRERMRSQDILRTISRRGDITSKARECLVSIGRMLLYLANESDVLRWPKERRATLRGMQRDVQSLSDHSTYLSNKIGFLLDALLGFVTIEQNDIIKIFTMAAVVFMPPTLIASSYGMNFRNMPELDYVYGYPLAIALMVISTVAMYVFFKLKKWL